VPNASLLYTSNRVIENFITFVFPDPVPFHGACLLVLLLVTLSPFTFISFTNGGGRKFSARCKHLMQTAASCGLESDFQMARSIVNVICHRIVKTALVKVDDVTVIKSSCN
jgi:hypothetical protein